jgi:hypothetical protein
MCFLDGAYNFVNKNLLARVGLVSFANTLAGVLTFPLLKTLFYTVPSEWLMVVSYVICLFLSFLLHGKYSFKANLTFVKFCLFAVANCIALWILISVVLLLENTTSIDVRLVQPVVAVIIQCTVILFYSAIFRGAIR